MKDLITEARELCERATPGPWEAGSYGAVCLKSGFKLGNIEGSGNAAFIARSRTLIPELCDALEKERGVMISESIFSGRDVLVPLADVQHIEKQYEKIHDTSGLTIKYIGADYTKLSGILVITDKTKWNFENDTWENAIWVGATANQAQEFLKAWCQYRHELEESK